MGMATSSRTGADVDTGGQTGQRWVAFGRVCGLIANNSNRLENRREVSKRRWAEIKVDRVWSHTGRAT